MRWTFKRLVIWFIAFIATGLGSSLFQSQICTFLQVGVAALLGLPLLASSSFGREREKKNSDEAQLREDQLQASFEEQRRLQSDH